MTYYISIFLLVLSLVGCANSQSTEEGNNTTGEPILEGSWKYYYSYFYPNDVDTVYPGFPISNDSVLFVFKNDKMYSITYPTFLEYSSDYFVKNDSLYFNDIKGNRTTRKFNLEQDTLLIRLEEKKGIREHKYIKCHTDEQKIKNLIENNVDWTYAERNWIVNGVEYINVEGKFSGLDHKLPIYLDLRPENKIAYHYSRDTLFYQTPDTLFTFTFSGLWRPGGAWSEHSLRLNVLTANGSSLAFYNDKEEYELNKLKEEN